MPTSQAADLSSDLVKILTEAEELKKKNAELRQDLAQSKAEISALKKDLRWWKQEDLKAKRPKGTVMTFLDQQWALDKCAEFQFKTNISGRQIVFVKTKGGTRRFTGVDLKTALKKARKAYPVTR
jgi:predicted RNase H-like nuclease (RuvC/YqgF family)